MPVAKVLKWTGIVLGVLLGLLLVWSAIVIVFGIRIDLGPFRAGIRVALVSYGYNGGRNPHTLGAEAVVDSIAEIPALVAGASVDPVS